MADRFIIEELVAVKRYEARCTVVFDGSRHTFLVRSTLAESELEGVDCDWPPELRWKLCAIPGGADAVYLRDFVEQLCRFFAGEKLRLPIMVEPHMR
ncbi:MAG: hypothetical protein ACREHD_10975 [Pirellulales bacterium]